MDTSPFCSQNRRQIRTSEPLPQQRQRRVPAFETKKDFGCALFLRQPSGCEQSEARAIFNSAQYLSLAVLTPLMGWLGHKFSGEHVFSVMGGLGLILAVV